jgi:hypothetical protein
VIFFDELDALVPRRDDTLVRPSDDSAMLMPDISLGSLNPQPAW